MAEYRTVFEQTCHVIFCDQPPPHPEADAGYVCALSTELAQYEGQEVKLIVQIATPSHKDD